MRLGRFESGRDDRLAQELALISDTKTVPASASATTCQPVLGLALALSCDDPDPACPCIVTSFPILQEPVGADLVLVLALP